LSTWRPKHFGCGAGYFGLFFSCSQKSRGGEIYGVEPSECKTLKAAEKKTLNFMEFGFTSAEKV